MIVTFVDDIHFVQADTTCQSSDRGEEFIKYKISCSYFVILDTQVVGQHPIDRHCSGGSLSYKTG